MDERMGRLPGIGQRYINLKQAATYLGLSHQTVYKWAEERKMPAHKLGRVWRFDPQELDQFVQQQRTCYNPDLLRSAAGLRRKGHENAYQPRPNAQDMVV